MLRALRPALLALASFTLCAAVLEVAARVAVHGRRADPRTSHSFLEYDPDLGWRKAALETEWLYGEGAPVLFRTNSHGLRGPERGYAPPGGVTRVLLLGDSFAEAATVAEESSLRAILERELDAAGCGRHEVINGGTSGYSTDQEYLFLEKEGWHYRPQAVVLLFFSNDLDGNTSHRKKPWFALEGGRLVVHNEPVPAPPEGHRRRPPDPAPPLLPWHGSYALRLLGDRTLNGNPRLHQALASMGLVPPAPDHAPTREWLLAYGPDSAETERRWEITVALIDSMRSSVEQHGARFAVLYVPAAFEIDERDWLLTRERWGLEGEGWDRTRVERRLAAACRARGIELVDPSASLAAEQQQGYRAYYRVDPHWTETGQAVAAGALAHALDAHAGCADAVATRVSTRP